MIRNKIRGAILFSIILTVLLSCSACDSGTAVKQVDMQVFLAQLKEKIAMPEMITLSEKRMESYYGINKEVCSQSIVLICEEGTRIDEIWLLVAKDGNSAEKLFETAGKRIEQLCKETENYLPDQYSVVKDGVVCRNGNNVALFISPDAKAMGDFFNNFCNE